MASFNIKKGMDIPLAGAPRPEIADAPATNSVAVYPTEYEGAKPRLMAKEGERIARGAPLFHDKGNPDFQVCAPASGVITTVEYGARRVIQRIEIERDGNEEQTFPSYELHQLSSLSREQIIELLLKSGLLALIRQRPFGKMAEAEKKPKSIFVNGMSTAPFHTRLDIAVRGQEAAFQAGLAALKRLTDGPVRLILPGNRTDLPKVLTEAAGVDIHTFSGPHPAGNTSVHIHHLDPLLPGDTIWTLSGVDLLTIGTLLLEGRLPSHRIVALGGPGVKETARQHYRIHAGASLHPLFANAMEEGELRIVNGDALSGTLLAPSAFLPFRAPGFTVLQEDRTRHFIGWLSPGVDRFSHSRTFLSSWRGNGNDWALGTNENGGHRAMVLTGLYDRYMPMQIMVDYLVRAVLANDTDEAIKHGILETLPEDFGLCTFVCPSKTDVSSIIGRGLDMIEKEGI